MANIDNIFNNFKNDLRKGLSKSISESAEYMQNQIKLSFKNGGWASPSSERENFPTWQPTSIAALQARKTYPKGANLNARQKYEFNAPTLVDTGNLRDSITIDSPEISPDSIEIYIGAAAPYIATHEDGGTITTEKGTFDVPPRPSHFITDNEVSELDNIFERGLQ